MSRLRGARPMSGARALIPNFLKFLRLRLRQVKNNAVTLQVDLRGHEFYPILAQAQEAADIGVHLGNLVVRGTLKGRDIP